MITLDAMREYEISEQYKRLANSIDKYLASKDSIAEGMYMSRKEYKMCSEALKECSNRKKGFKDVIRDWFTKR